MRLLVLVPALAFLVFAITVEYSGLIDIYYKCGAYVTEFGSCAGDCLGFIMAVKDTSERPPIRVFVGDVEIPVNYTRLTVDDVYHPSLWAAYFRARAAGPVRVKTRLAVGLPLSKLRQGTASVLKGPSTAPLCEQN